MPSEPLPKRATPTAAEEEALTVSRIAFASHGMFFCAYYYDRLEEYITYDIDTLATDSVRMFINPKYFLTLKPMERAFTFCHETAHAMLRHPEFMRECEKAGKVGNLPYDAGTMNVAMDLLINANLVKDKMGSCNPAWIFDPKITGEEALIDIYRKIYRPPPPGGGGSRPGTQPGSGSGGQGPAVPTYGKGSIRDKLAEANGGRFDEVRLPQEDPISGEPEVPSEMDHREAIAKAAQAAKEAGQMPGSFQRFVDEVLEPKVRWQDHLRFTITGKIGHRKESWDNPNRRRICLEPIIYIPGKRGFGCEDVTVVIDNSGSIEEPELAAFFAEGGAILADCKPKLVRVIWCDALVRRVEEARSLDELSEIREKGSAGGGGTDFRPPFAWLKQRGIKPDTLVYLTDGYPGYSWPDDPGYPVVWAITTDVQAPWGETVRLDIN